MSTPELTLRFAVRRFDGFGQTWEYFDGVKFGGIHIDDAKLYVREEAAAARAAKLKSGEVVHVIVSATGRDIAPKEIAERLGLK